MWGSASALGGALRLIRSCRIKGRRGGADVNGGISRNTVHKMIRSGVTGSPYERRTQAQTRLAKTPKVHFLDAGLATGLRRYQPSAVGQRTAFGPLLETFVFGELARLSTFHPDPPAIYHLRTLRGEEVDFILESHDRRIVAIEVKAGATLHYDWFKTMRMLRDATGVRLRPGNCPLHRQRDASL